MSFKKITIIIIMIAMIRTTCLAQLSTAQFLLVAEGARAEALGGSIVADPLDYTASFWNPAGLAYLKQGEVGFANTQFPTPITNNFFSVVYPYKYFGFGFHVINYNTRMTFYDVGGSKIGDGNGEKSAQYMGSFAYRLSPFFSLGLGVGQTSMQLYNSFGNNYKSSALSAIVGGLYKNNRLSVGFSATGGSELKFVNKEKQPSFMRLGTAYSFLDEQNLLLCLSYIKHTSNNKVDAIALGSEYILKNKVMLRWGYNHKLKGKGTLSCGVGFKHKKFMFDYAFTPKLESLEGMNFHRVGLSFKFSEVISKDSNASAPEITIQYLKNDNYVLEPINNKLFVEDVIIVGKVNSDRDSLLDTIQVKCNGKNVVVRKYVGKKKYYLNEKITLNEGLNIVEVVATDSNKKITRSKGIKLIYERNILKGEASIEDFINFVSTKGKNWAVLIGVEEYPANSGFTNLDYVANDIKSFKKSLINEIDSFDEERIYTLGEKTWTVDDNCNYAGPATRRNIELFLGDQLPSQVLKDDRVLIFFSGHGITLDTIRERTKQGFLAPVDGIKDKPFSTCVSMDIINQLAERIPAKQILFIVDACNSGLVLLRNKGDGAKKNLKNKIESFMTESRQAMTAGKSSQSSQISGKFKQSIYTHYLLEGLKGKADSDSDGVISVHELHVYVRAKVSGSTRNYQIPQMGRIRDGGEGDFFFIVKKEESMSSRTK